MRLMMLVGGLLYTTSLTVPATDIVWHNPPRGSFFWWQISNAGDGFYLPSVGAVLKSSNARDWSIHYHPGNYQFFSIAKSPSQTLAAALLGDPVASPGRPVFLHSTDGTTFTPLSDAPHYVYKIAYGSGRFVASGFQMSWSEDGVTWTLLSNVPPSNVFRSGDLIFAGGKFLRATPEGLYVSTDGLSWTQTGPQSDRVDYYNGTYVLAGEEDQVSFSTDGMVWRSQPVTTPNPLRALAAGAPGFVAVGDNLDKPRADAIFSADGTNWVEFSLPFPNRPWDIKFIDGEYLMVGDGGLLARSTDGTNWTKQGLGPTIHSLSVAKGNDTVVAVGSVSEGGLNYYKGGGFVSGNGVHWEAFNHDRQLRSVAFRNGTFAAVGLGGYTAYSTDGGRSWTQGASSTTQDLFAVTASPDGFVAVGRAVTLKSANGIDWTVTATPHGLILDVACGNGVCIATAETFNGALISTDLVDWTSLPEPYRWATSVEFGNGVFVLGSGNYVSPDGVNWQTASVPALHSLIFSEGVFCGVKGGSSWTEGTEGYVSLDGQRWHKIVEMPNVGARFGRFFGRFLGIGSYSAILELTDFGVLDFARNPDHSLNLRAIHPAALQSAIEASNDFTDWKPLAAPSFTPAQPAEYFRLKLSPKPE